VDAARRAAIGAGVYAPRTWATEKGMRENGPVPFSPLFLFLSSAE
jgi:hypothetical protein